jgi:putative SOS response-associated peptidase YedK
MCGRFVQAQDPSDYADFFSARVSLTESLKQSWNVAPTDQVYAVAEHDGERRLGSFRWGLVPWFAKDIKVGARHINARAETVDTTAAFKRSFQNRRCIIPADGFYEWERRSDGSKLPHYIHAADGSPLAFAGLWGSWRDQEGGRITSCTIITTDPNELVGRLHDRMPVVLAKGDWDRWLDPGFGDPETLRATLRPPPSEALAEHAVSSLVNDVKNNAPQLTEPWVG